MENTIADDIRGALGNIGNPDGVALEVSIDQKSIVKLGLVGTVIVLGAVALNHFLKNI